ncbi:MAG: M23 family metallopeptidase [Clostridiales bacterium]|nr:M23 family metallopeptidase [Clostridiales bacterium]
MKDTGTKFLTFLKRNAVYFVLAFCILAIGISAMFAIIHENSILPDSNLPSADAGNGNGNEDGGGSNTDSGNNGNSGENNNDPSQDVENPGSDVTEPVITTITFIMPVENATSIGEYSETMVFNSTLSRYSAHKAVDFFAEEGTPVLAVYDGTVENIENSLLKGYIITIDHGNGLKTVYNSLADGDNVTVGQKVSQGDVIGEVSVTNRQEYKDGAHLHFEVLEEGVVINPDKYLSFEDEK